MVKVCFVISTMEGGGAQRVISVYSDYLVEKGYEVDIVTTTNDYLEYELNSKVAYIPLSRSIGGKKIDKLKALFRIIKCKEYDYIYSFQESSSAYIALCKLLGLKFHFCASERMDPTQDSLFINFSKKFSYSIANRVVFQTTDAQNFFGEMVKKKSRVIYNPLNKNLPQPCFENRKMKIVSAIRLDSQKNPLMLISGFKIFHDRYPEYSLEIFGKGKLEYDCKQLIEKLGIQETCLLRGFSDRIYDELSDAKMFVLSSDYEGVSNAMLEALSMGIPVVSTDHPIGGARMFIKNGFNGFLTEVGNEKALAEGMKAIAGLDETDYLTMANNASCIREDFDTRKICGEWLHFSMEEEDIID